MIYPLRLNLILDDFVRFNRKVIALEKTSDLKLITFFRLRYGLGYDIVSLMLQHMGFSNVLLIRALPESFVTYQLRSFFLFSRDVLDQNVRLTMAKNIKSFILLKTIRGFKHLAGFPVRGQRRRSNAVTASKNVIRILKRN